MSLLSSLFKSSKKVNLTPDKPFRTPREINPQAYGDLSQLSHDYITGKGTGFGDDFTNKMTNPVAEASRRNYKNFTAPATANAYTARGLNRSSLAANELGRQEADVESGISQMMAQFDYLNRVQQKQDTQFGAQVGQNLLSGDVSQDNQVASASERLANATAADARGREKADNTKAGQLLTGATQLLAPSLSAMFTPKPQQTPSQLLQSLGVGGMNQSPVLTKTLDSLDLNTLGGMSQEDFLKIWNSFQGGF